MDDHELLAQLREQTQRLKAAADDTSVEHLQNYVAYLLTEKLIPEGLFIVVADSQHPELRGIPWEKLTDPNKIILKFSKHFSGKDLRVNDGVLMQTLSFDGKPHHVQVPVAAIFRLARQEADGTTQVWAFREEPHHREDGDDDDGPQAS